MKIEPNVQFINVPIILKLHKWSGEPKLFSVKLHIWGEEPKLYANESVKLHKEVKDTKFTQRSHEIWM